MKIRSILVLVVSIFSVMAISIVGSLAYLTSNNSVENTFTVGNVKVSILEENADKDIQSIVPGLSIRKDPKVINNGESPCYVRVKVIMPKGEVHNNKNEEIFELAGLNTTEWSYNDGYYYFNRPLESGEKTGELFTTATLKAGVKEGVYKSTSNNSDGNKVMIDVFAEAIQSQGFSSSVEAWNAYVG